MFKLIKGQQCANSKYLPLGALIWLAAMSPDRCSQRPSDMWQDGTVWALGPVYPAAMKPGSVCWRKGGGWEQRLQAWEGGRVDEKGGGDGGERLMHDETAVILLH